MIAVVQPRISATYLLPITLLTLSSAASADFLNESKANLTFKNLYFDNDYRSGPAAPSRQADWGQGFVLDYTSGFTSGSVGFGLDAQAMATFKLDSGGRTDKAGRTRQPGASFPLRHDNSSVDEFSSAGITGKVSYNQTIIKYGNLMPTNPVVVSNLGRIAPQTYIGAQLISNDIDKLTITLGQLSEAKGRINSGHTGLSVTSANMARSATATTDAAPARFVNEFNYGGLDYKPVKDLVLQYYFAQLKDFYNQNYFGLRYVPQVGPGAVTLDARYWVSDSNGKNSSASGLDEGYTMGGFYGNNSTYVTRGEVDNRMAMFRLAYTLSGHTVGVGYQELSGPSDLPWLNQTNGYSQYTYTATLSATYTRAGERTRMVDYGYDFAASGIPGLRFVAAYFYGDRIATQLGDRKEFETDYTLSYVVQSGTFKDLNFTWFSSPYRTNLESSRGSNQNRFIVSYTLPLF